MRRRLFTLLSALSLLLCVATCLSWLSNCAAGWGWNIDFERTHSDRRGRSAYAMLESGGGICFELSSDRWTTNDPAELDEYRAMWSSKDGFDGYWRPGDDYPRPKSHGFIRGGFSLWRDVSRSTEKEYQLIVPCWFVILVAGLMPGIWVFRKRRGSGGIGSLCPSCGYDLRATPERCPECGAVPEPAEVKA
jgi:hypothetical protein